MMKKLISILLLAALAVGLLPAAAMAASAPKAPRGGSVKGNSDEQTVTVTWNKSDGADKYCVYRKTDADKDYKKIGTVKTTTYIDKTADPGTEYRYAVSAAAGSAESDPAYLGKATLNLPAPASVTAKVKGDAIRITWKAVKGAEEYGVFRAVSEKGSYTRIAKVTGTSFDDETAAEGRTYYYKLRAYHENSKLNSGYGEIASAGIAVSAKEKETAKDTSKEKETAKDTEKETAKETDKKDTAKEKAPSAPTVTVSYEQDTGRTVLSWKAMDRAKTYDVYRSLSRATGYEKLKSVSGLSYTDTTSIPGKKYYYRVKAVGSGGESAYSVTVKGYRKLPAPASVTAKETKKTEVVTVSWKAVSGAEKYNVYRAVGDSGSFSRVKTTTDTHYEDTDISAGKTYRYKITALCAYDEGNSGYSDIESITVSKKETAAAKSNTASTSASSASSKGEKAVEEGRKMLGTPYRLGGNGPSNFDCSGFTLWCIKKADSSLAKKLPRTSADLAKYCADHDLTIDQRDLKAGDLVFWTKTSCSCGRYKEVHHVGVYAGSGKVIEASSGNGKVVEQKLWEYKEWRIVLCARVFD